MRTAKDRYRKYITLEENVIQYSHQPNPYAQAQGRQLGLSAAQVSTLNFGWHTIYAIENIQKRAPMLSSSEAFGMVQGMAEQAAQQYVTAYLASTKKTYTSLWDMELIRVVVHTGRGFGHQRAAITLMEKLRELGFKGTFDVQCDDRLGASLFNPKTNKMYINNQPLVSKKLMNMIPGFASMESSSVGTRATHTLGLLGTVTISALPHDYATNSTFCLPAADLAVCAADDNSVGQEAAQAKVLGASAYIGLEPTDWYMGSCFVADADGIVTQLPRASNMRLSSVAADQLPNLSAISLSDIEKRIIKIIENSNINSQLVYGLYPDRNYSIESNSMTESGHLEEAVEMQRLIEAHLTLNPGINQPTLLLLPQSIALEFDFKERVKNKNSKIFFIDLTLEDADIGVYKTDAVIIAYTGHLQQACFDYLMLQGTTLPPVIEGCNARETCESAGRPFLHGSGKHDPLKRYAIEAGDKQALHADACLCLEQGDERYISQLAQYMRESMESDSQLLSYHEQRHAAFLKRPDACEIALDTLGIPYEKKYLRSLGTTPAVSFFTSDPDLPNKKSPRIDRRCTLS